MKKLLLVSLLSIALLILLIVLTILLCIIALGSVRIKILLAIELFSIFLSKSLGIITAELGLIETIIIAFYYGFTIRTDRSSVLIVFNLRLFFFLSIKIRHISGLEFP